MLKTLEAHLAKLGKQLAEVQSTLAELLEIIQKLMEETPSSANPRVANTTQPAKRGKGQEQPKPQPVTVEKEEEGEEIETLLEALKETDNAIPVDV